MRDRNFWKKSLVFCGVVGLVLCSFSGVMAAMPVMAESGSAADFEEPYDEFGWFGVLLDISEDLVSEEIAVADPAPGSSKQYPRVSAHAVVLMDVASGQICYERAAHSVRPPASTTKIMTAILAIESDLMDSVVTVSEKAANTGEASLHLDAGQKVVLKELVEGALVRSGNDACVAIAEAVGGDMEAFVRDMNRKAAVLGAVNTRFKNPNGLPNPDHVSTAYDLALMARYALQNPVFAKYVSESSGEFESVEPRRSVDIRNTNKLLNSYPNADGVKTGTTSAAGKCLVASATKDGRQLVCVVLDAPDRFGDCHRLLEWGFHNTETLVLGKKGDVVVNQVVGNTEVPFSLTADAWVLLKGEEAENLTFTTLFPHNISSVRRGDIVGSYVVYIGEREVFRCGLQAGANADAPKNDNWFKNLMRRD
ncbi:MAG: D-alanyl-D-alanine carboxypeptidase [Peptococcaceae bacterium]|nr:D-alanyl-D-alanine carboxypeptidase [Peptococcaceae bacterium]